MSRSALFLALGLLAVLPPRSFAVDIYKCAGEHGETRYTDKLCEERSTRKTKGGTVSSFSGKGLGVDGNANFGSSSSGGNSSGGGGAAAAKPAAPAPPQSPNADLRRAQSLQH